MLFYVLFSIVLTIYTCSKDAGFSTGTFDIFDVLILSFDIQNSAVGFELKRYLSLCHMTARAQFLALLGPFMDFEHLYCQGNYREKKR